MSEINKVDQLGNFAGVSNVEEAAFCAGISSGLELIFSFIINLKESDRFDMMKKISPEMLEVFKLTALAKRGDPLQMYAEGKNERPWGPNGPTEIEHVPLPSIVAMHQSDDLASGGYMH